MTLWLYMTPFKVFKYLFIEIPSCLRRICATVEKTPEWSDTTNLQYSIFNLVPVLPGWVLWVANNNSRLKMIIDRVREDPVMGRFSDGEVP